MNILSQIDFPALLTGSTFFGTGGGGSPAEANESYDRLRALQAQVQLAELNDFSDDDLIITVFAVGSIASTGSHTGPVKIALARLEQEAKQKIAGIIPVEIGPASVAMVLDTAYGLGLPVVDADVVGGRSTPEVFLETITLFNMPRTPATIAALNGDCKFLAGPSTPQQEEEFFRTFATAHGDQAYVVGYPMRVKDIRRSITWGTVSRALEAGREIQAGKIESYVTNQKGKQLYTGSITTIENITQAGFTTQLVNLEDSTGSAKLFVKNESLILWVNNQVVLTCPDLIILTDRENRPLYNAEIKQGLRVNVYGLPTVPLWRSEAGMNLFQPKTFGFDLPITLLT